MRRGSSSSVRIFYPKFDKEELIQKISKKVHELAGKIPLLLIVLFGSYARGNYTVASDVDLLIVYKGIERNDAFATAKKTLDIPRLQPHVYSEGAYERLRNVIDPMIADGVVLFSKLKERNKRDRRDKAD